MSGSGSSDSEERVRRIYEDLTEHERARSRESTAAAAPAGPRPEEFPKIPGYEIKERVGEGATSIVYRAWDLELQRGVALKVLSEGAGLGETARLRFRREAQAAAGLVHPNVVTVHDAGEAGGRLYIVMEFLEGRSLRELLADGNATQKALLQLIEKVARGVAAAHDRGIVHRDLKPANILVTAAGEPKVGDFGLAHLLGSESRMTRTGTAVGTPLYMAPEQVEGNRGEQTPRTDVHALGAILYEALTRVPPFDGKTVAEIYRRILDEEPRMPRDLNPKISKELENLILKALEKDPARRYPTAAAFADDLARLLAGEQIDARRAGPAARAVRRVRQHPIAAAAVVLALAAIAGVWRLESAKYVTERDATVSMMRETARLSLEAALRLREKGDLAGMRRHLPALEEAYRGARERAPQMAEIEYLMGRMHRALMDTDQALRYQEEALRKEPEYGPALYERAVLLARQPGTIVEESLRPRTTGVRAGIVRDLSVFLKSPGGGAGMSEGCLLTARGMLAHFEGRRSEAREILERAVKLEPHLDEAWEALTRVTAEQDLAAAQGERERSWLAREKELTEAILKDRGFLPHLLGRGDLRRDRGNDRANRGESPLPDLQSAEEDYSEALRLNGESQEAWLRRAQVRTLRAIHLSNRNRDPLKDYADAEADLDRLAKLAPKSERPAAWRSVIHVLRGTFLAGRGRDPLPEYDRALEAANEGLRLNPESEDATKRRAIALIHRASAGGDPSGDFESAERDLERAGDLLPESAEVRMWRGILWLRRAEAREGRREDSSAERAAAETALSEAIVLNKDYARAWMWRGVVRTGRAGEKDLSEALRLNVGFTEAWFWRGVLAARRGDWAKAEADLTQALTLDPGYADAWMERANVRRERTGDSAAAAEDRQAALRINPALKKKSK